MNMFNAGITALASYAPEKILSNQDLEKTLDTSDEWITTRTGIKRRHIAAEDEFSTAMAIKAVENLQTRYGTEALHDVDLVIVATNTPDALFPCTASLVQEHFNLQAGAFDLLAGCPGWLYALSAAQAYVKAGLAKKVLTIGSEALSKIVDWNDRSVAVLFGDAAGAAIVEAVPENFGFKSMVLGSDGAGAHHLYQPCTAKKLVNGTEMQDTIYMNGREVFKFAVRVMDTATVEALEKAGLSSDDISLFIPHQANARIIEAARERLELPPERVVVTVNEYGNSSTASIPLAIEHALNQGKIQQGDNLLFVSFGAGLTWAATVLTWYEKYPRVAL